METMHYRDVRKLLGKTQVDVAAAAGMTQSDVSRFERRRDHRVSVLRRMVRSGRR